MANLRYLPLSAPIRYTFQYSNFNYLIAGCLIEAVSGMTIEEFLRRRNAALKDVSVMTVDNTGRIYFQRKNKRYEICSAPLPEGAEW